MRLWHRLDVVLLLLLGVSGCAGLGGSKTVLSQRSDGSRPGSSREWLAARYWSRTTRSSASHTQGDDTRAACPQSLGSAAAQTDIWSAERTNGLSRYFPKLGSRDSRTQPPSADLGYPTMATRSALLKRPEARSDRQVKTTSAQERASGQSDRIGQVPNQDASRDQASASLPSDISDLLTGPSPARVPWKLYEHPMAQEDVALLVALADPTAETQPSLGLPQQQFLNSPPHRSEEDLDSWNKTPSDSARPRRDDQLIALTSRDPQEDAAPAQQPTPPSPTTPSTGSPPPLPDEPAPTPVPAQTPEPASVPTPEPVPAPAQVPTQTPAPAPVPTPAPAPAPAQVAAPAPASEPAAQPPSSRAEPVPTAEPGGEPVLVPTPHAGGSPARPAVQPPSPVAANQQSAAGTAPALAPLPTSPGKAQATAAAQSGAASGQSGVASGQSGIASGRSAPCQKTVVRRTAKPAPAPKQRWSLLAWFKSLHHPEPPEPLASSQLPSVMFPTTYNRCLPRGEQGCLPSPSCVQLAPQSQSPASAVAAPCTRCTPRSSSKSWFYWGMMSDFFKKARSRCNDGGCQGQCRCSCHGPWIRIHAACSAAGGSIPAVVPSPQASFAPVQTPFLSSSGSTEPRDLTEGSEILNRIATEGLDKAPQR